MNFNHNYLVGFGEGGRRVGRYFTDVELGDDYECSQTYSWTRSLVYFTSVWGSSMLSSLVPSSVSYVPHKLQ
ncbi:unnamed protein product [Moneuplotes crassus]|uniref:Uncharacterized protein n=1 Tax=Euplotes crassus TaxID=5936 RepID=A0AAD1Y027_EUPCR|nr:unnamed protein product [Moneuplotes crassus]